MAGRAYSPREYIEHQLTMTEEEKEARTRFFAEMFEQHNAKKRTNGS